MTPEAPMRGNRRGFRRWFWIALPALPAAALVLPNLWLASPFGRAWITAKIQRRVGLEASIGSATITPWNGVRVSDLRLLQPPPLRGNVKEPLAMVDEVRLAPVWRSWLKGRPELQSIELDGPAMVLPVELLADLARARSAPQPPPSQPVPPAEVTPAPPQPPAAVPAPPAPPPPNAPPPSAAAKLPPTGWLRVKNASFTLLSASSGKSWFLVSGVSGAIPVSGSPAQSRLRVASITAAGNDVSEKLDATLDWQPPFLTLKPLETEVHGLKATLAARVGMLSGLPLQIEAQLPRQKPMPLTLPADGRAEAETVAGNARFRGILLAPATWQGELVAEALAPAIHLGEHDAKFDRGGSVIVLRGGILSCAAARLIGDDLSFLGNATLLADGRLAGHLRMVAPPESATAIARRVFPNLEAPSLTELSTPQRAAFDLEAFGNLRQIFLRPGQHGPVMELTRPTRPSP